MRERARIALRLLVGTVLGLLLLEVAVRLWNPFDMLEFIVDDELLWRYRPNQVGRVAEYGVLKTAPRATINALGFRGPHLIEGDQRPRILFLGDSATFGAGVADGETFSALLQKLARDCVVAVNAGVGGWGVFQYEALLHRIGGELRPRLVVVDLGTGSTTPRQPFATVSERERYLRPKRFLNSLREYSRLTLFVGRPLHRLWMSITDRNVPTEGAAIGRDLAAFHRQFRANTQRLVAMRDLATTWGGELTVLVWPGRFEHNGAFVDMILSWGRASGIPVIDLSPAFARVDQEQWRIPGDWHPNTTGHAIAAHEVLAAIAKGRAGELLDCGPTMKTSSEDSRRLEKQSRLRSA